MYWLERMQQVGIAPNQVTFNCMIDANAKFGAMKQCNIWLQDMIKADCHPDEMTLNMLMRAAHANPIGLTSDQSIT